MREFLNRALGHFWQNFMGDVGDRIEWAQGARGKGVALGDRL
jgi:hypothetical protein